jgi:hypothetical protein
MASERCGRKRRLSRLDLMIDAAVDTERLKLQGRVVNHVTGGREVFHVLPDFSRLEEGD